MKKIVIATISLFAVFSLVLAPSMQAAAVELYSSSLFSDANLLVYYRMDDLTDSKGSLTLTNTGSTATTTGKFNSAYTSGTSNTTKNLRNTTALSVGGGTTTLVAWVKLNGNHSDADHPIAVSLNDQTAKVMYSINFTQTNTGVKFSRLREAVAWDEASYTVSPGTSVWHHYALTYDGTLIRGYYDGNLVATSTASGNGVNTNNRVNGPSIFASYTGSLVNRASLQVDDFAIFNRVLSASEIASLYDTTAPASSTTPTANIINFE